MGNGGDAGNTEGSFQVNTVISGQSSANAGRGGLPIALSCAITSPFHPTVAVHVHTLFLVVTVDKYMAKVERDRCSSLPSMGDVDSLSHEDMS